MEPPVLVVRGRPTADETAALVAVLVGGSGEPAGGPAAGGPGWRTWDEDAPPLGPRRWRPAPPRAGAASLDGRVFG
jgi:hypothetical protein